MEISRVTRSKQEAKASYNRMSKFYEIIADCFEGKYTDIGLKKLNAKQGEIVLEIGFGTGQCIIDLAHSVAPSGKVYGIDISEGMCTITNSKIKKAGLGERVVLRCGDAVNLPYDAYFFDAVFISFTLELFDTPEIPIVLHECHRVLRNGGRMCIVAMVKKEKTNVIMSIYEWLHKRFANYFDCRPIFVEDILLESRFQLSDTVEMSLFGLPIEIALVKKEKSE